MAEEISGITATLGAGDMRSCVSGTRVSVPAIRTDRLLLRRWLERDRAPFAPMNADPEMMAHFPALLSREDSDTFIERIEAGFRENGFGRWALEVRSSGAFIRFTGLAVPNF